MLEEEAGEMEVYHFKREEDISAPIIECAVENNPGIFSFFCDSGAGPCLLKEDAINTKLHEINRSKLAKLTGISEEPVFTLGTIELKLWGVNVRFHLVPANFPIETNGLLGRSFFSKRAAINFIKDSLDLEDGRTIPFVRGETINLRARSTTIAYVRVINDLKQGYLRELKIKKGIYAGKALVINEDGKAKIPFFNTTEEDICIVIPTVSLEECDEITNPEVLTNPNAEEQVILKFQSEEMNLKNKKKIISKDNVLSYEKEQKELEIKEKLSRTYKPGMFSELLKLRELLSKWDYEKTPSHGEMMEILSYLLLAKEVVLKAETLNISLGERIMSRVTRLSNILRKGQNNCPAALVFGKQLEHDIQELIINLSPEDMMEFEKTESQMSYRELGKQNVLICSELRSLKNLFDLRRLSISMTKQELNVFLEKLACLIKDEYVIRKERNQINEILMSWEDYDYNYLIGIIYKLLETITKKMEMRGIEMSIHIVKEEDRLNKITSLLRLDHLNSEEYLSLIKSIDKHKDRFHLKGEKLPATNVLKHRIKTVNDDPIFVKQFRLPPCHRQEIKKQVDEYLEDGVIKPSMSPYSNPVFIVPKKPDSKGNPRYRMVLDFRKLNEVTIGDSYPLPNISDILDQLGGTKYFTVLDLFSGYHQVELDARDSYKTAFSTPGGHYEFTRLPFGLSNSPRTFQRLMDIVLSGLQGAICYVYLDDVVIYAKDLDEHEEKFDAIMCRLREANMKLQIDKCEFLKREVVYLGHIITQDGVKPCPDKIKAVKEFPVPKTVRNVQQFLGLANYYRRFIEKFSFIAKPLFDLLRKENKGINWTKIEQEAFDKLKDALCKAPVLQYPDFNKKFIITTDASGYGVGAILSQGEIGEDRPIAFASRVLTDAERKWDTTDKEALAILYAVEQFRPYIYGSKFLLCTDHKALTWIKTKKDPNGRVTRWRLKLSEYDYDIIYKSGKDNEHADALSRNPVMICNVEVVPNLELKFRKTRRFFESNLETILEEDENPLTELPTEPELERMIKRLQQRLNRNETTQAEEPEPVVQETRRPSRNKDSKLKDALVQLRPRKKNVNVRESRKKNEIKEQEVRGGILTEESHENINQEAEAPATFNSNCEEQINQDNTTHPEVQNQNEELEELPFLDASLEVQNNANENIKTVNNFAFIRDPFFLRKDSLICFTDTQGNPLDAGAKELEEHNKLARVKNLILNEPHLIKHNLKLDFLLPIKAEKPLSLGEVKENIKEVLSKLKNILLEKKLGKVCFAKSSHIENLGWEDIIGIFCKILGNAETKILFAQGIIKYPEKEERKNIIIESHCSAVGGHRGVNKTISRIKQKYVWERMKEDVAEFVKQCVTCQVNKLVRVKTRQPMLITTTPTTALDTIAMDIVGPLRKSLDGNEYILTIQCLLTKFALAIPLKDYTSKTVADVFVRHFICYFGAPRVVLTDQGTNFLSSFTKRIAKRFKIKQIRTTAYHPAGNGSAERQHSSLAEYVKVFAEKFADWDQWIHLAMFNHNTNVHESTKHTPYELVFGRLALTPSYDPPEPEDLRPTYHHYLRDLITKLNELQGNARIRLIASKERNKRYFDKKINPQVFKLNDFVWLLKGGKIYKHAKQYKGPYQIVETYDSGNFKLQITPTLQKVVHANRLKLAYLPEEQESLANLL